MQTFRPVLLFPLRIGRDKEDDEVRSEGNEEKRSREDISIEDCSSCFISEPIFHILLRFSYLISAGLYSQLGIYI